MPTTFAEYDLKKANDIVTARFDEQCAVNLKFYNGDHWQDGAAWTGPRPTAADKYQALKMDAIKAGLVSRNVVGELVSRHTSGVLGRELHWGFTPTRDLGKVAGVDPMTDEPIEMDGEPDDTERALIGEAEAALTEWWDKREIPEILQSMLDGALNIKRGPLRLYVPPGVRDATGVLVRGSLSQCLDYIWLQHLGTDEDNLQQQIPTATVYTDKNSRRDVGIFVYEYAETDDGEKKQYAEMTFVDELGNTVLRIVDENGDIAQPQLMPLGGRLTMYELTRKWLVTPQIVSQQKALNKTKTMCGRNDDLGGFLERTYLNVKWPTEIDPATGKETPKTLNVGGGAMNVLQGSESFDEQGRMTVGNPQVVYRDPVSPSTFIESEDAMYLSMLQEGQQLHYALAGDAVVSGESRKQARDAYHKDLQYSAGKIESSARWLLETALAMATYFAGSPGRFETIRAFVQCRIDSGPISAEEKTVAADMWERGVWAKETAQSETGIEDVDAENAKIDAEQAKKRLRDTSLAESAMEEAERRLAQGANGNTAVVQPVAQPVVPQPNGGSPDGNE